ncbi:MAG TPA: hypothetical protein VE912_13550 [Bacteroidales bacterium]|nr:hypothetical protein [Bacteroidales bacterium]
MALPSFFRTYKNRQFDYKPIYYNAEKEELQERIRSIELEMGIKHDDDEKEGYKPRIDRGSIRGFLNSKRKVKNRQSNIRLLIIMIFLLLLAYFLFYT